MNFRRTTAINKILRMIKRVKIIQGGTSAGKTIAILAILIDKACKTPGLEISVVSESIPHLRRGAYKDFIKIMKITGRYNPDHHNKSNLIYTFSNGSYIEFFSVDDEAKIRGARRHILYVNEGNNIRFDSYHQLASRTEKDIYIDFNPTKKFWAHDEVLKEDDSEMIVLTYLDNEARPDNVDEMMRKAKEKHDQRVSPYWINWWKVYGLGEIGVLQGAIWTDWSIIPEIPKEAELMGFGLDFGFSNSPTAVIAVYKWRVDKVERYVFDQWIYERKLTNPSIAQKMHLMGYEGDLVYCDSAEPKSIEELVRNGIQAEPCAEKRDIRSYAIDKIASQHFYITERSVEMKEDIENYVWAVDKNGESLNKPKKENDHSPDAVIYFTGTEDKYDGTY